MLAQITRPFISNCRSLRRRYKVVTLVSSILLTALVIGLMTVKMPTSHVFAQAAATPTPTPPNFSTIGNAFAGYTHIMRQDDVVLTLGAFSSTLPSTFYQSSVTTITTKNSAGTQNFDGILIPRGCDSCTYPPQYYTQDQTSVTGRFFHTVSDSLVSYPSHRNGADWVDLMTGTVNGNGNASFSWNVTGGLPYTSGPTILSQAIAADFTQDGYDDLLMIYSDFANRPAGNVRMLIATAIDVNDPSKGFKLGPPQSVQIPDSVLSATVGDFNGDGQNDVAWVSVGVDNILNVYTAFIHPSDLTVTWQDQAYVDTLPSNSQYQIPVQIAAGNFTGSLNPQIVIANPSGSTPSIKVRVFDFAQGSYAPVVKQTWDSGATGITVLKMLTSKYAWDSPYDVVSLMLTDVDSSASSSYVDLLTVDPGSYAITKAATVDVAGSFAPGQNRYVALDIAVGNFNAQKPNPADPSLTISDPNLQLAVGIAYAQGHQTNGKENFTSGTVGVVQVIDPSTGAISPAAGAHMDYHPLGGDTGTQFQMLKIRTADLQGRSMRLGGGFKIRVERTQPSMILAMPPMHADYVTPVGASAPTLLNFSYAPDAFYSKYEQDTTTGTSFQHNDTTSMSFNGAEKVSGSTTFGETNSAGQLENGFTISASFEAKQDVSRSKETQYGEYSSGEFNLTQQTSSADVVWFSDNVFYLYVYEVVGHTVCKGGQATCSAGDRVPLTIMFSGPTASSTNHSSAETLEWYQPIWEYGNILSYPGNYGQLQLANPKLDTPLNNDASNSFATDSAPATESATIVNGGTSSTTWQASHLFTEDSDVSVTGAYEAGIPIPGVGSVGDGYTFGVDVNLGGSDGTASLKTATTTSTSSDKITIAKNAIFQTPAYYQYGLTPIIYGEQAPVGVDQDSKLGATFPDQVTYGPLRTGFTVDPISSGGAWWKGAYQTADVGFNHPNRWTYISTGSPTGPLPANCVSEGTTTGYMNCAIPTASLPANPGLDLFHDMRGFFITQAENPGVGPQMTLGVAGDKLSLQTRVYNYSFVPSSIVHVMFFGMKWNAAKNHPADATYDSNGNVVDPGGSSFFIGEQFLNPIPGFSSQPNAPLNSTLASVTFDTTGYDDTNIVFWVAVWQEDNLQNHNLVKDPTGKGLTATPGATTVNFTDVAGYDELVANPLASSPSDPAQVSFSNNIGLYRVPFYIQEKSAAAAQAAKQVTKAKASPLDDTLERLQALQLVTAAKVDVTNPAIKLGQGSEIYGILHNDGEALNNVVIYFYDGDPDNGGKLFDSERVAHIRAKEDYRVGIMYYPKQCGAHQIYIKVTSSGLVADTVKAANPLQVECATAVCTVQTCMKSPQYYLLNAAKVPNGMVAVPSGRALTNVSTSNTTALKLALRGGQAASQFFNQQFVALQLNLLAANDPSHQAEQSNLLCYKVNFQPVQLKTGVTLNPGMKIAELLKEARSAVQRGDVIDQRAIANVMHLLNGDDPSGRCK